MLASSRITRNTFCFTAKIKTADAPTSSGTSAVFFMTKQKLFVQLHQTDLAVYLADGTVGKAGGTLGTGFQHAVHIGLSLIHISRI